MRGELQLLPLINIVFLLLIFFMLAGVVSVPDDAAATPPRSIADGRVRASAGELSIAADGSLYFEGQALAGAGDLPAALRTHLAGRAPAEIRIRADADSDAVRLIAVMAALREAGVSRVRLLTRKPAGDD